MQRYYLLLVLCAILSLVNAGNPPWHYETCVKYMRDTFLDLPGIDSRHACYKNLDKGVREACKATHACGKTLQNKHLNHGETCSFISRTCLPDVKNQAGKSCRDKISVDVLECGLDF